MSVIDAIIAKKLCGGGGGSVPKPLTYDYMPEGYPTKAVGTVTVMAEQELAFAVSPNGAYGANLTDGFEVVEGQTYTVKWDGAEYECVGAASSPFLVLGNLSISGMGNDTGEPFVYAYDKSSGRGTFGTLETTTSHTISAKRVEEAVTPMAEKFLPAGVGTTALITHVSSTNTYSSDLSYDELHKILLDHREVVLWEPEENRCSYLTKWEKKPTGNISLAFAGGNYSLTLHTDGSFTATIG